MKNTQAMIRLALILSILHVSLPKSFAQFKVYQNENGQVLTTVDRYGPGTIGTTAYNKYTYLGSPFLTFPVWQKGKIWLDTHGKAITCELAYNLLNNEVLCRFPGDSTAKLVTPEVFTVNGNEFVRQQNKLLGIDYRLYATVLYDGPTKLLLSLTKRIDSYLTINNGYTFVKENSIAGEYKTLSNYYIRKGEAKPEFIVLTKNSILAALYDQSEKIAARIPDRKLTLADVASALAYYDSLTATDWVNKSSSAIHSDSSQIYPMGYAINKAPLSKDPVFNQALHHKILYPSEAWTQGIYGRVYAGFEIGRAHV